MCISPVIRYNPAYSKHRDEFCGISRYGNFTPNLPVGDSGRFYPPTLPRPYHLCTYEREFKDELIGYENDDKTKPVYKSHKITDTYKHYNVTADDVENVYAVRPDGTFVPIWVAFTCGKCVECGIQKQKDWRSRMFLEQLCYDRPPLFLTLTYNDSNLPANGVSKEDIAKFFNRLHLYCTRLCGPTTFSNNWRHICFSEYGSLRHRPHYHAVLFDFPYEWFCPDDLDIAIVKANDFIHKCWGKGFTLTKVVDSRAFHYVSKYVGKDISCGVPFGKNPNFVSSSRRFGGISLPVLGIKRFVDACATSDYPIVKFSCPDGQITTFTIPKYLRNKLLPSLRMALPVKFMDYIVKCGRLCYCLNILYTRTPYLYKEGSDCYKHIHASLINEYPLLSHYFNYVNYSEKEPFINDMLSTGDFYGMERQLMTYYSLLQTFDIDWQSVRATVESTEIIMSTFVNKCISYLRTLPKYSNFERNQFLLTNEYKYYVTKVSDGE